MNLQTRLIETFQAAFPNVSLREIPQLEADRCEAWDSLATMTLFSLIEEEFDINIPDDAAEKIQTVGQAIDHIEKAVEGNETPAS